MVRKTNNPACKPRRIRRIRSSVRNIRRIDNGFIDAYKRIAAQEDEEIDMTIETLRRIRLG